jgi:hypothetical protein
MTVNLDMLCGTYDWVKRRSDSDYDKEVKRVRLV